MDVSSPLQEGELSTMLHTTLTSFRAVAQDEAVKVVRLRYFAGMPQGLVVYGATDTRQLAFNADRPEGQPDRPRLSTGDWQRIVSGL